MSPLSVTSTTFSRAGALSWRETNKLMGEAASQVSWPIHQFGNIRKTPLPPSASDLFGRHYTK
jgi:hypothetical protein